MWRPSPHHRCLVSSQHGDKVGEDGSRGRVLLQRGKAQPGTVKSLEWLVEFSTYVHAVLTVQIWDLKEAPACAAATDAAGCASAPEPAPSR